MASPLVEPIYFWTVLKKVVLPPVGKKKVYLCVYQTNKQNSSYCKET
jgi:hypothetical protein